MHNMMLAARTTSNQSTATIDNKQMMTMTTTTTTVTIRETDGGQAVPLINQLITDPTISNHRRDVVAHAGDGVVVVICSGNRFRQNVSHPQHPCGRYSVVSSSWAALCWVLVCVLGGVGGVGGVGVTGIRGAGHYNQLRCAASQGDQPVVMISIRPEPPVCHPHHHPALQPLYTPPLRHRHPVCPRHRHVTHPPLPPRPVYRRHARNPATHPGTPTHPVNPLQLTHRHSLSPQSAHKASR